MVIFDEHHLSTDRMNQRKISKQLFSTALLFLFLLRVSDAQSQRLFTATGIMVSTLSDNLIPSDFKGAVFRPSISVGFETKQWQRLSAGASFSNFTSGGKQPGNLYDEFDKVLYFDNYSFGVTGNYYLVNEPTVQFYLGVGPRLDYVHSQKAIYTEWDGNDYSQYYLSQWIWGVTGSIGVNFQMNRFNLGVKSNYYYRYKLYTHQTVSPPKNLRDHLVDLQLVFGVTLGKKQVN